MEVEVSGAASQRLGELVSTQEVSNSAITNQVKEHLRLSLSWSAMQLGNVSSRHCDILLKGAYGTALEAVSLLSFGLVRPAILSLRSHYELNLQFLYYKDHPVEWSAVQSFRDQPNLPAINKKYLANYYPGFDSRFKKLLACKTRENDDCYTVLSGIAHGTAINSITTAMVPAQLIETANVVASASSVFLEVSEHVSDIYLSCYSNNWLSVPSLVRSSVSTRMEGKSPPDVLQM